MSMVLLNSLAAAAAVGFLMNALPCSDVGSLPRAV